MPALAAHHLAQRQPQPEAAARRASVEVGVPVRPVTLTRRTDQHLPARRHAAGPGTFAFVRVVRGPPAQGAPRIGGSLHQDRWYRFPVVEPQEHS